MDKVNKLTLQQPEYPALLSATHTPPKTLYVRGSAEALQASSLLAVIGGRKPTAYGRHITEQLIQGLAGSEVVIVSGLALGIDAVAHQAALQAKLPTIAVLPAGLDTIYPRSNQQIGQAILEQGGALVSEYPPGYPPQKNHFIERNRIVSGLSHGILVTEAGQKSGTLHTVKFALEEGRSVLAVPGNITSAMSEGANSLIARGARPVLDSEDILDELGVNHTERAQQASLFGDTPAETEILEILQREGICEGKALLEQSAIDIQEFNQSMTMLEINGKIKSLGADNWSLT